MLVTVRCVLMLLCLLSTDATLSKKDKKKGKKDADKVRRSTYVCVFVTIYSDRWYYL